MAESVKGNSNKASCADARTSGRGELRHALKLEQHPLGSAALARTDALLALHRYPSA